MKWKKEDSWVLLILCLTIVSGLEISSFDDMTYLNYNIIDLSSGSNITHKINISKDAIVTDATMNISSRGYEYEICTSCDGQSFNLSDISSVENFIDEDKWLRIPEDISSVTIKIYNSTFPSGAICDADFGTIVECNSNFFDSSFYLPYNYTEIRISMNTIFGGGSVTGKIYIYNYNDTISNLTMHINDTQIWNFSGQYNTSQDEVLNFSSTLNTALNSGACDCNNCTLYSGKTCEVNFLFGADTEGKLYYDALNIEWTEPNAPTLDIVTPTGEQSGTNVNYNLNITDNWEADTCIWWVTTAGGLSDGGGNHTITCSDSATGTATLSFTGTSYLFHLWANDTSGNVNYTNQSFSTATPSGGSSGGGGSPQVIIEDAWTMELGGGISKYEISMPTGFERTFDILFENIGEEQQIITLSCEDVEGSACKYVTFPEEEITLEVLQDTKQTADFTITIPDEAEQGDYQFNIIAKDSAGRGGAVSVFLSISLGGLIIALITKVFTYPYILYSIGLLVAGFFGFSKVFPKKMGLRGLWILLSTIAITLIVIYLI